MTDQEARQQYVRAMAQSTVWLRQRFDGMWEAITWEGKVISTRKSHGDLHREIHAMAGNGINNIWAITTVVSPHRRRPHMVRPTRRSL